MIDGQHFHLRLSDRPGTGVIRNILIFQALLVLACVGLSIWQFDTLVAKAALYGGLIAIINSLQLLRHLRRAERIAGDDANGNVRIFYLCAMERLVMTIALFAIGLGALKLAPLPVMSGFILGQLALFFGGLKDRK